MYIITAKNFGVVIVRCYIISLTLCQRLMFLDTKSLFLSYSYTTYYTTINTTNV